MNLLEIEVLYLACFVDIYPFYKRLGFKIIEEKENEFELCWIKGENI